MASLICCYLFLIGGLVPGGHFPLQMYLPALGYERSVLPIYMPTWR